jgi:hypothetical protein
MVTIAADGAQKKLLQYYFPNTTYVTIPKYNIRYSRKAWWLPVVLFFQLPKIAVAIYKEHRWLQNHVTAFDLVISDNRYGLYNSQLKSTFITHQLIVKAPFIWSEKMIQQLQYYFINKFSECWVPDTHGYPGFAADLSHPAVMPKIPVTYIGVLSQFSVLQNASTTAPPIKYKYCFLLSGPEPQRTILQNLIESGADSLHEPSILIEGRPSDLPNHYQIKESLTKLRYARGQDLLDIIMQSEYIVCRSGYSTLMELLPLHKKMILIPTPGQTEQEYLASSLASRQMAVMTHQATFDLNILNDSADKHCFIFAT